MSDSLQPHGLLKGRGTTLDQSSLLKELRALDNPKEISNMSAISHLKLFLSLLKNLIAQRFGSLVYLMLSSPSLNFFLSFTFGSHAERAGSEYVLSCFINSIEA